MTYKIRISCRMELAEAIKMSESPWILRRPSGIYERLPSQTQDRMTRTKQKHWNAVEISRQIFILA